MTSDKKDICRTCANAQRSRAGHVISCSIAPQDGRQQYYKMVLATIEEQCTEYCPSEAQKHGKFQR